MVTLSPTCTAFFGPWISRIVEINVDGVGVGAGTGAGVGDGELQPGGLHLLQGVYPAACASQAVLNHIKFGGLILLTPGHDPQWYLSDFLLAANGGSHPALAVFSLPLST
jgi:hypothetical protein